MQSVLVFVIWYWRETMCKGIICGDSAGCSQKHIQDAGSPGSVGLGERSWPWQVPPLCVGLRRLRRCQAGGISEDTSPTLLKSYAWQLLCLSPQVPRCLLYPSVRRQSSKNSLPPHPLLCSGFNECRSLIIKIQIMETNKQTQDWKLPNNK